MIQGFGVRVANFRNYFLGMQATNTFQHHRSYCQALEYKKTIYNAKDGLNSVGFKGVGFGTSDVAFGIQCSKLKTSKLEALKNTLPFRFASHGDPHFKPPKLYNSVNDRRLH